MAMRETALFRSFSVNSRLYLTHLGLYAPIAMNAQIETLAARVGTNPKDNAAWRQLLTHLVHDRNRTAIEQVLTARHQQRADAATYAYAFAIFLLKTGGSSAIEWLWRSGETGSAFRGIFTFVAGLERVAKWDLIAASKLLREGTYFSLIASTSVLSEDKNFAERARGQMTQQANLLEPPGYTPSNTIASPEWRMEQSWPAKLTNSTLLAACCDADYLSVYAERYLTAATALLPEQPILIHVINPSDETWALQKALSERFPLVRFSTEHGPALPHYYASVRFLIAADIMKSLNCHLILTDIDIVLGDRIGSVIDEAKKHSLAVVTTDEVMPSLRPWAGLLAARNSDVSLRFFADIKSYLVGKLAEEVPVWTVDQAALFRAMCLFRDEIHDLSDDTRGSLDIPRYLTVDHVIGKEDRLVRRTGVERPIAISFDNEIRPVISFMA